MNNTELTYFTTFKNTKLVYKTPFVKLQVLPIKILKKYILMALLLQT
jgi:hypothetical protein